MFHKDGYSLNLIAPDHLLTGLFKGVLTITFIQLPSDEARDKLQICLRSSLSEYEFQSQSALYNNKKRKLMTGLTMSSLYCLLTVLPSTLEALGILDQLPSKGLITNLHRFFSLSFWWPVLPCDGLKSWEFVHGSNISMYHRHLKILAANFVKSVSYTHLTLPTIYSV